jgi:hypothetical protein
MHLIIHLLLVLKLRMCEALFPLPHTPSRQNAELKEHHHFTFTPQIQVRHVTTLTQPFKDHSCAFNFFMFSYKAEPPYTFLQLHPTYQRYTILHLFGQPKICSLKRVCVGYSTHKGNSKFIMCWWTS